jgi:hypothetical protein
LTGDRIQVSAAAGARIDLLHRLFRWYARAPDLERARLLGAALTETRARRWLVLDEMSLDTALDLLGRYAKLQAAPSASLPPPAAAE